MAPIYDILVRREQPSPGESNATLAVSGLVIALAAVSVGLRFYTRIFTKSGLKADDWSIFCAVLFTLATAAITLAGKQLTSNSTNFELKLTFTSEQHCS